MAPMARRCLGLLQLSCAFLVLGSGAASGEDPNCPTTPAPVCGSNGFSYLNKCLAAYSNVAVEHTGYCKGHLVEFSTPIPEAPKVPLEHASTYLTEQVATAYSSQGFTYLGRTQLASQRFRANNSSSSTSRSNTWRNANSGKGYFKALRVTPRGDMYAAKFMYDETSATKDLHPFFPAEQQQQQPAGVTTPGSSQQPLPRQLAQGGGSSSSSVNIRGGRKMLTILGTDDRKPCPSHTTLPYQAIGELDFSIQDQPFICTGVLVKPDKVLTAAHCVYDMDTRAFVAGLDFSPARYRDDNGTVVDPFAVVPWKHATIFQEFPNSQQAKADIAVVELAQPIGLKTGVLGLRGGCDEKAAIELTTAGYPSDKDFGTCVTDSCKVQLSCKDATQHHCDTYLGQSGSPFWDDDKYVRGIHVRGLPDHNEFTTINKFIVDKVAEW